VITLFTCPKPFRGHIGIIQRNAIKSWTLLKPKPEIILIGDEEGILEVCKELDLIHIPTIEKNEFGTPLVSSVFQIGQENATQPIVGYINADIILMNSFLNAVNTVVERMAKFLMVGRRWDVAITELLNFESDRWETNVLNIVKQSGTLHWLGGMDYFVFPRGMYREIPDMAIGRLAWDNWFVWRARANHIDVVDATSAVIIVHQNHEYMISMTQITDDQDKVITNRENDHNKEGRFDFSLISLSPEIQRNHQIVPWEMRELHTKASTWILDKKGTLRRNPWIFSLSGIRYQLEFIIPVYWPLYGRLVHKMRTVKRSLSSGFRR
jgi:hypothetical protein